MGDLNDLYYFVKVVEHGGFTQAGRALDVPKSTLSRRIAALEAKYDVRLLQRTTRHFTVTETGREFHERCLAVLVEADAAREVIERRHAEPRGVVRVSCPTALLEYRVSELVARFMAIHPQVQVHLEATNRRVDLLSEGFDLALRVRFPPLEDSDLVMRVLADSPQRLVAAPHWLDGRAPLSDPAALAGAPSLDWGRRGITCGSWSGRTASMRSCAIIRASSRTTCTRCAMRRFTASASCSCRAWSSRTTCATARWSTCCPAGRRRAAWCTRCFRRGAGCCRACGC